jgi:hypothetical protein
MPGTYVLHQYFHVDIHKSFILGRLELRNLFSIYVSYVYVTSPLKGFDEPLSFMLLHKF